MELRLILLFCALSLSISYAQLLRTEGKIIFGADGHDQQPHRKTLLGGDGHDQQPHKKLFGEDGHDHRSHGHKLLGRDGHDQRLHKKLLGEDGHDHRFHGRPMLGADGHDQRPHGKKRFGVDGHDHRSHKKQLLGADGHDQRHHGQPLLGGGDHDLRPHGQKLLGEDGHDQRSHGQRLLGQDGHDQRGHVQIVLGADGHDQRAHSKMLLGEDGHDQRPHGHAMLGGDGHDQQSHSQKLLGTDGHDQQSHGQTLLGGDGHDQQPHGQGEHTDKKLSQTHLFKGFMRKFNKTYSNQSEYKVRLSIFRQNLKKIHVLQHNERGTAKYGATKFADLTEHEFRQMLGLRPDLKPSLSSMRQAEIPSGDIPSAFDWRDHGIVTPVKNQGMCGSCWAFSVTGNVEGQWALKHKHLYSLSEQELVDCDTTDDGCNGGMPENAYEYIEKLGGLETESDYPYEAKDDKCHFNKAKVKVTVNGSVELPENEDDLARWLVKNGPISIGINANALQFYVGGVSHPLRFLCNPKNLDHGMLIVGYGVHTTKYLHRRQPYWIVKNSWGPDWGEQGYYRVYRGDGTCGVNQMATSAIVP